MKTTEVVFYQIKKDKINDYSEISKAADQYLETRPGFISRSVRQDHEDNSRFIDIVEWDTLEEALGASESIQKEPGLKQFFAAFDKVISFNHYYSFN